MGNPIMVALCFFGYLLLPPVMVAAGRFIFKERISTLKFIAVLIGGSRVISTSF